MDFFQYRCRRIIFAEGISHLLDNQRYQFEKFEGDCSGFVESYSVLFFEAECGKWGSWILEEVLDCLLETFEELFIIMLNMVDFTFEYSCFFLA